MNDEPPPTSPSNDYVTFRTILALGSFFLAGFLAYFATKAMSRGPGKPVSVFSASGEGWTVFGRMGSKLQRADHVAFFDDGKLLAMSCPRYSKITLWNTYIPFGSTPVRNRDVDLQGRPVGLTPLGDKILVLERPPGDDRHIKPGFFEVFDGEGKRIGEPVEVGWEPDQIRIVDRDGETYALILFSGAAEGESNRGAPSLMVAKFDRETFRFEKRSQVDFETDGEDPLHFETVATTIDGKPATRALVCFGRKPGSAWVDWTDPAAASILTRHAWPEGAGEPARYVTDTEAKRILAVPGDLARDAVTFPFDGSTPEAISIMFPSRTGENYLNAADQRFFAIDHDKGTIGRYGTRQGVFFSMPLKGPYGFGSVRLTDVAVHENPQGQGPKVAAVDRSGGLHWISGLTEKK